MTQKHVFDLTEFIQGPNYFNILKSFKDKIKFGIWIILKSGMPSLMRNVSVSGEFDNYAFVSVRKRSLGKNQILNTYIKTSTSNTDFSSILVKFTINKIGRISSCDINIVQIKFLCQ